MRKYLLIALLFIFFTCLLTFPAVFHLSDKIIGDGGDNYQFLGFQYIAKTQFENGVFPFAWTNYWRYPVGFDFSIGYDSTLFLLVGIIFYQIIGNPVTVYNLSILFFLFLNGILSYTFFRKISGNEILGILGSLIYGFSFYTIARLGGHPNLVLTGCFPFFIYSLIVLKERQGDFKSFFIFTFCVILVFLTSLQYLLILIGAIILLLPVFIIFYSDVAFSCLSIFSKRRKYTIYSLLTIIFVFLFFNSNRANGFLTNTLIIPPKDLVFDRSPNLVDFFLPNNYIQVLITSNPFPRVVDLGIEKSIFLGWVEIVIFLWFLLSKVDKKIKVFLSLVSLLFLVVSLGCKIPFQNFYPYCYIFNIFPFRGITQAGRFNIILYIFLTTAVLFALKKLSGFSKHFIIPLIIILVILERLPSNFYLSDTPANEAFIKAIRNLDSSAVLDLPLISQWAATNQKSRYDLYSVYYQKPIVNGYIHWSGNTPATEVFMEKLSNFQCGSETSTNSREIYKNLAQILKNNHIKTIVFHKDLADMDYGPSYCNQAIENINFFLYQSDVDMTKVYEDNQRAVLQLL